MLVDKSEYLSAGIHIGMKTCSKYMKQFVYKTREDGLSVFNLEEVDKRLALAAGFLSKFKKLMVVSHKPVGDQAAKMFAHIVKGKTAIGRFSPGTLTNPSYRDFYEPDVVLITDPVIDSQAVEEAKKRRVPIVALCDTSHDGMDIDLVIPLNNNGKKALALAFWILTREVLKQNGVIKKDSDFKHTLKDFGDDGVKKVKTDEEPFEGDISVEIETVDESKSKTKEKPKRQIKKKRTETDKPALGLEPKDDKVVKKDVNKEEQEKSNNDKIQTEETIA